MENSVERYLVKITKQNKGYCYKWVSPGTAGVPDRILLLPGARVYLVECKDQGKKPSPVQKYIHKILKAIGFHVYVIDSKEKVDLFFKNAEMKHLIITTISQILYLLRDKDPDKIKEVEDAIKEVKQAVDNPLEFNIFNMRDTLIFLTEIKLDLLHG